MRYFLDGNAPERLDFPPMAIWLELRGARGAFSMRRLDRGVHDFRMAMARGTSLAAAIEGAATAGIDPGAAFAGLFADALVTRIETRTSGARG